MEHHARSIFSEIAREALKKINLYEDAIENKRLEAQNALIFAGRIAQIEGRNAAAIASFKKAKNIRDDADAHLMIGLQLVAADDLDGAMAEFETALLSPNLNNKPTTKSEVRRSMALVFIKRRARGSAREQLGFAQEIDDAHRNYLGLARTHEMIGDLHAPRANRRGAAKLEYEAAIKNYKQLSLTAAACAVRKKLDQLNGQEPPTRDTWWVRTLDSAASALLRRAEKHRVRAQTIAA